LNKKIFDDMEICDLKSVVGIKTFEGKCSYCLYKK